MFTLENLNNTFDPQEIHREAKDTQHFHLSMLLLSDLNDLIKIKSISKMACDLHVLKVGTR